MVVVVVDHPDLVDQGWFDLVDKSYYYFDFEFVVGTVGSVGFDLVEIDSDRVGYLGMVREIVGPVGC